MRDAAGNKVFIESQFWRNDPDYDARALKRMSDVMAALEKLGYKATPTRRTAGTRRKRSCVAGSTWKWSTSAGAARAAR